MSTPTHRLAAVWFADIARYSRLARADEEASLSLVRTFQALARREIPRHGGHAVKFMGDGVLAEFPSALGAVQAALAFGAGYVAEAPDDLVGDHGIRSAIHVGEVNELDDGDLYGDGVNVAARILEVAEAGDVLVSEEVRRLLRGQRALAFRDLGERRLRGVGRISLYSARPVGSLIQSQPSAPEPARRLRPRTAAAVAGVALVGTFLFVRLGGLDTGASWVGFGTATESAIAGPLASSVAVLPFEGEDADDVQAAGFTDAIVARLAAVPDFTVISAGSAGRFESDRPSDAEAARVLGVETVMRGRVAREGSGFRVDAWLLDGRTGEPVWRRTWRRAAADLPALQAEIAERIVDGLRLEITARTRGRVATSEGVDPEANRLYVEGLHHWNRRDAEGVTRSIELFRRALDVDPGYARAYAGLASAYVLSGAYAGVERESADRWARAAAERAIALDPDLGEPHAVLGLIAFHDWAWADAEREFRTAIELDPGSVTPHHWYGVYLAAAGRTAEASAAFERAEALDPLSAIVVSSRGIPLVIDGDWDGAIAQFRKALALDPDFGPARGNLIDTYQLAGRYEDAIRERKAIGEDLEADALERGLSSAGSKGYLRALDRSMEARRASAFERATVRAALGDSDGCFEWLEESYRRREPGLTDLRVHPWLASVRSDPRFADLTARVGLP